MRDFHWSFVMRFGAGLVSAWMLGAFPAVAANGVRVLQGESFWEGDPGPITDSFWVSGQYKYDPNGYLERNYRDTDTFHLMTVYGDHAGKTNCVFRKRVQISTWDFQHPILRVCRQPPKD